MATEASPTLEGSPGRLTAGGVPVDPNLRIMAAATLVSRELHGVLTRSG